MNEKKNTVLCGCMLTAAAVAFFLKIFFKKKYSALWRGCVLTAANVGYFRRTGTSSLRPHTLVP